MKVAVLGGGALGTLTALHLDNAGATVDLVEARTGLWSGASGTGEGKVHLGYVYGLASERSLRLLLEAAGRFATDVEQALGRALPWPDLVSSPFRYLVADTSSLSPEEFATHARRVEQLAPDLADDYLGARALPPTRRLRETDGGTLFATPERSVDVPRLSRTIAHGVADCERIRIVPGARVADVQRRSGGWELAVVEGRARLGPYDAVVNCTWESAAALDHLAGIPADPPNLRLRAFLHGRTDGDPLAVTVTHGPFGDFVRFAGGRTYASWYPTGILGFEEALEVPPAWEGMQRDGSALPELATGMIDGLAPYVPEVRHITDVSVQARIVVARGSTDISDPASRLHERSDAGVVGRDGWISVRSPKLTTAPMLARRAAEHVALVLS